jgi:hypothetical protein
MHASKVNGKAGPPANGSRRIVATYDYRDEQRELLFQVVRYEPKDFRQRRPVRRGWVSSIQGVRRVLFRLPELLAAPADRPVFVVEGEKDVDNLSGLELLATCNAMGAGKWLPDYNESLRGRYVVILPDNDDPGRNHAEDVARQLNGVAASVSVLELPGLPDKGDVSDWLAAGGTKDQLLELAKGAKPWRPAAAAPTVARTAEVLLARCAAEVVPQRLAWLWPAWLARGTLALLDGDPGAGKSTLTVDLAARVSRGSPMPGGTARAPLAGVLLLSAEDDAARTIRPRLEAAGADLTRVRIVEAVREGAAERPPVLPLDLPHLQRLVEEARAALVIVDPLSAYLGGQYDAHRDHDVRRALFEMARFATATDVCLLVVRHLNKLTGGPALYRGGGSIGIVGAARSALLAGRDPDDPARRVLAITKSNLAPLPRALYYALEGVGAVARIGWGDFCDLTADQILPVPPPRGAERRGEAKDWLRQRLAAGPVAASELVADAEEQGISEVTLRRAKKSLRVSASKAGYQGKWTWELPAEEAGTEDAAEDSGCPWPAKGAQPPLGD